MSPKIAIAAISAIGITGTGGIVLYKNQKTYTTREELQKQTDIEILDPSSFFDSDWQQVINDNNGESKNPNLKEFIRKHDQSKESAIDTVQASDLKKACEEALKKEATKDLIDQAKSYCTKQTTKKA